MTPVILSTRVILWIDWVILFIDSCRLIYWLESSYWVPLYGFATDHQRPTTPSILAPEGNFFVIQSPVCERYLEVLLGQAKIGCVAKHNTITTALWISQQLMLQSRIGQKEMILWGVIYHRERCKKLNWFCIAGCERIVMGWGDSGDALLWSRRNPTTTTVLWILQQPMLQSRIGQKEVIRWGVIYRWRTAYKNFFGFKFWDIGDIGNW